MTAALQHKADMLETRLRRAFTKNPLVTTISVAPHDSVLVVRVSFEGGRTVQGTFGPDVRAYDLAREARREIETVLDELIGEEAAKAKLEMKADRVAERHEQRRKQGQAVVDQIVDTIADGLPTDFAVTGRLGFNSTGKRVAFIQVSKGGNVVINSAGFIFTKTVSGILVDHSATIVRRIFDEYKLKRDADSFPPLNVALSAGAFVHGRRA